MYILPYKHYIYIRISRGFRDSHFEARRAEKFRPNHSYAFGIEKHLKGYPHPPQCGEWGHCAFLDGQIDRHNNWQKDIEKSQAYSETWINQTSVASTMAA